MKTNNYIICLLDLNNDRMQRGIYFLQSNQNPIDIGIKLGISCKLKKLLSNRWELHLNEVPDKSEALSSTSYTVTNLMKRLIDRLEEDEDNSECRTILLPANTPGVPNDS